jgi:hypothetical protein
MEERNSISHVSRASESIIGYSERPAFLIFSDCCTTSSQVLGAAEIPAFCSMPSS